MKKIIRMAVVAAAGLAMLGGSLALAAPADAANRTPHCVTKTEYKKIKNGMTLAKVKKVTGISGKRVAIATSGGYGSQIRSLKTCSKYSAVSISLSKNPGGAYRVDAKSAIWVN